MSMHQRARLAGATSVVAAMALAATSLPTLAAPDGTITVQGQTQTIIELTIATTTVDFGTTMRPDGTGNGVDGVFTDNPAGACFWWDGSDNVQVRSNVEYDLDASVSGASVPQLHFTNGAAPTTYAECGSDLAANAGSLAQVASGASWTSGAQYDTHLSVVVPWTSNTFNVGTTLYFAATSS